MERIAGLERRLHSASIGAAHAFAAHPLFAGLLSQGMRPQTAMALFNGLADRGFSDATPESDLRWALAQELRKRLDPTTPSRAVGTQVFVGPSGSGKTSLVLKLALHPSFYGRRSTGILVVLPEDESAQAFHNPVDVYRRFGLAVQTIQHPSEMPLALERMRAFDQILIDTPPAPRKGDALSAHLRRLRALIEPIMPLQVTFVYSAADALDGVRERLFDGLPLTPDAVALTHLDETTGWGRLADWLLTLERPVPYVSCGPRTPDDLYSYSPTWFVEEMMQLR
jgi:flagellar biosynthesis protein FlhF